MSAPLKLRSWNVNGLRAVAEKGFRDWFDRESADVVGVQEIKAFPEQLDPSIREISGYRSYFHPAQKPGYSGVAIWSRLVPHAVIRGLDGWEDLEGRVLQLDFGSWVFLNAYFPNSQREHTRLQFKLDFCEAMLRTTKRLEREGKHVVLCGDFNIAHEPIDLRNPTSNVNNAGFLPEERAWMSKFLASGFRDTFRDAHPGQGGHYTWWSYRPGVREKNIGWRLDYFCVGQTGLERSGRAHIQDSIRGSDHCPVGMEWHTSF